MTGRRNPVRRIAALALLLAVPAAAGCGAGRTRAVRPASPVSAAVPEGAQRTMTRLAPAGASADPRMRRAHVEPDPAARAALYRDIAEDPAVSRATARIARMEEVRAWARARNLAAMQRAAGELEILDDLVGADLLHEMAIAHAETGRDLDRGLVFARRALEILASRTRPRGVDRDLWERQMAVTRAMYRDTLGRVLLAAGDVKGALRQFRAALAVLPESVAVTRHLGNAWRAAGDHRRAFEAFVRVAAAGGPDAEGIGDELSAEGAALGLKDYEIEAKVAAARGQQTVKVRSRATEGRMDAPAPVLSARSVDGAPVLVTGSGGHPTVVLFWSPASPPSMHALQSLEELRRNPGAAGPFRLVAVAGSDAEIAARAAREIGVQSPLALDPGGADAAAVGVRGLPTALVLDADGRVRYRNEGWTPGYRALVQAQIEALPARGGDGRKGDP